MPSIKRISNSELPSLPSNHDSSNPLKPESISSQNNTKNVANMYNKLVRIESRGKFKLPDLVNDGFDEDSMANDLIDWTNNLTEELVD